MASPSKNQKTLSPLNTHWHNRSLSSVASDAATFHSALQSVELRAISSNQTTPRPQSPNKQPTAAFEATKMSRQDSGYADDESTSTSRRTSTSSARHSKTLKRTNFPSRPCHKRASRSTPTARAPRPAFHTRQTTPVIHAPTFFQFPVLADPEDITPPPPPPPVTCQYWTSDSTRRLEYAAIDAASRGVKGFFVKLVPDCILPPKVRRTRFHGEEESDAGSVRRYRLTLPEEKEGVCEVKSGIRRWWRRGSA
jgi:hypothetical protein